MSDLASLQSQFIRECIANNTRVDTRSPTEIRTVKLSLGPALGQATARFGKTRVFANVSCSITRPSPANPTDGSLIFNTEFSPMASPDFPEKSPEREILVSRMLERAFKQSRAVDTEGLCIVAGEKVWMIRVDVRVLDACGNILDTACLAASAALLHFKRPDTTVEGDVVIVHSSDEKVPIGLAIHHVPVCVTFAIFG